MLLISGYFLDPLFWFGYYFCFYHGMRALINHHFQLKKDLIWMIIFTAPVVIVWLIYNEFIQVSFIGLLFPSLFALTVAHMQLDNIIKLVHVR
jgi:membrane-associated HD superfamily phosphohydrolase